MADYTKLTREMVATLLAPYDLGELTDVTPLVGGLANSSVKITTRSGTYTLTVCDEKNPEEIQCLTRVLSYLDTWRFPTTRVIKTGDNRNCILYRDQPVYIKQFLEGQVRSDLSPAMLFQVGQALADLHRLDPPPGIPGQFPYNRDSFSQVIDSGMSHPYVDWLKHKTAFLEKAIDPAMPKGFIHGDLFWDNLVFSNDTLVAVLDFEEACLYYKLFDIGMCVTGCCVQNQQISREQVLHLLSGYQQTSPLTAGEEAQLPVFMEYAAVAASFWRFRQYNIRRPCREKKDSYLELARLADQVHDTEWGSVAGPGL